MTSSESTIATVRFCIENGIPLDEIANRFDSSAIRTAEDMVSREDRWAEKMRRAEEYRIQKGLLEGERIARMNEKVAERSGRSPYMDWREAGYTKEPDGRGWTRFLVRSRDEFTCQDCGEQRPPKECGKGKKYAKSHDVHHLNGMCGKKSRGYDSVKDMDKLITLCHSCHFRRHDFSEKGKQAMSGTRTKKTPVARRSFLDRLLSR